MYDMSLPARGVWIEILDYLTTGEEPASLPARGVWIEIKFCKKA